MPDSESAFAGCVAQVHRGTLLRDVALGGVAGEVVAVKVVHPAARARIAVDLDLMRGGVRLLERLAPSTRWLGLVSAIDEFSRTLERQMDMRLEAHHLELFGSRTQRVAISDSERWVETGVGPFFGRSRKCAGKRRPLASALERSFKSRCLETRERERERETRDILEFLSDPVK